MADQNISFALSGLKELEFFIKDQPELFKDFDPEKVKNNLGLNFRWDFKTNALAVVLVVEYSYIINKTNETSLLKLSTLTEFNVVDLKKHLKLKGNNEIEMNQQFLGSFVAIAFSTTRGILFARTSGSFMNRFILPVISPLDFINANKAKEKNKAAKE